MKGKIRYIISILFILMGIGLLLFAFRGKWETKKVKMSFMINLYQKKRKKLIMKKIRIVKKKNYPYIDMVNPIAVLEIPKINLKVVVAEGTEDEIIKYAVGHFKDTAMPGEMGNFALAGHRNYDTGEFFLKIKQIRN